MSFSLLVALVALHTSKAAVVVDLLALPRPDNCSLLLDQLEDALAGSVTPLADGGDVSQWKIEVRLPRAWDFSQCGPARTASYLQPVDRANIVVVEGTGPPYSLQHGTCGERGLAVVLPVDFLEESSAEVKLSLNQQWLHYTMGDFSRSGFVGDPLYPIQDMETSLTSNYSRPEQNKQELLCGNVRAAENTTLVDVEVEPPAHPTPIFTYSLPGRTTTQYLLILDQSAQMANRWSHTRRSLHQFIDLLPAGSLLSVVTAGFRAREVLPVSRVTEQNRDGLHGRIPRRVLADTRACLSCAIHSLGPSLGENSVVLVISGANSTTQGLAEAVAELARQKVPVYLVAWPSLAPAYLDLAHSGRVYTVIEGVDTLQPRLQMQEILLDILSRSEGRPVRRLHLETHHGLAFSGAFSFTGEEEAELRVTLNIHEEDRVEFFEVRDPDGMQRLFSKWEDGMVYLHFSGRLPAGLWTYRAKLYPASKTSAGDNDGEGQVWVDVVTSSREDKDQLKVELLTSAGPLVHDPTTNPVRVYAHVTSASGLPVSGATAMVLLYGPGGEQLELELHDDGLGYPDITKADGVYSSYIPSYSSLPGYYSLRLVTFDSREGAFVETGGASSNCCGSSLQPPGSPASPVPPYSLVLPGPALYLGPGLGGDLAPPNRVTDLKIVAKRPLSLEVELTWTAPGGDWDYGKAANYDIRCHTNPTALSEQKFESQGIAVPAQLVPRPEMRGSKQTVTVTVPWPNELFFFALVAVDEGGQRSLVSNLEEVLVVEEVTSLPSIQEVEEGPEVKTDNHQEAGQGLYIAGGILSGVVVVILTILAVVMIRKKRKRSLVNSSSSTDDPNFPVSDIKIHKKLADSPPLVHTTLRKVAGTSVPDTTTFPSSQNFEYHQNQTYEYQPPSGMHSPSDFVAPKTPNMSSPTYGQQQQQSSMFTTTPPSIHSQGVLLSSPLTPPSPRVLLSWLDTLEPPSRPRQKMLTNGSLVSLRDSPPASDSSKLTGSSSLESSQDEEERMGRSATLGRRVGERYTNHQQYGLPYSSVTLGRPARLGGRPRENNLFCDLDSRNNMLDTSNLSSNMLNNDLGEERLRGREERRAAGERVRSRSLKRTESFV